MSKTNTDGQPDQGGKPTQAILYARFSPRPHAAECQSCAAQLDMLREYCAKQGWEIIGEFRDDALSGKLSTADRPGLYQAAYVARKGQVIVVERLDRLFRNMFESLAFQVEMERKGVKIMSICEESACQDSPESELIRNILMALADYERKKISARTSARMQWHIKQGRLMGRECPYGWKKDLHNQGMMIPDWNEQMTIKTIRMLRDERGMTVRKIADYLNANAIPTRHSYRLGWNYQVVAKILARGDSDLADEREHPRPQQEAG